MKTALYLLVCARWIAVVSLENGVMSTQSKADEAPHTQPASAPTGANDNAGRPVPIDDANIFLAPYAWKCTGAGRAARAEAGIPGAYLKTVVHGTSAVRLLIDGSANDGCPPTAMPLLDFAVDHGAFKSVQLTRTGEVYALPLASDLERARDHAVEIYLRATPLAPDRWRKPMVHLRLAGIELDAGGELRPVRRRTRRAIGFGDSITEGVCAEALGPYYADLRMNNARVTWFPLVCAALDCEYGQIGTGGQGMARTMEYPPLPQTWDRYDPDTSRLVDGRLRPEPDYVFCMMGTNDYAGSGDDITLPPIRNEYTRWVRDVRRACPHAAIFCIVPPLGWHGEEIAALVDELRRAGDQQVFLIDTAPLKSGYGLKGATEFAEDGVHPSVYGNAMLGAFIAAGAQQHLSTRRERGSGS